MKLLFSKISTIGRFILNPILERAAPHWAEEKVFEAWLTPPRFTHPRAPKGGRAFQLETSTGTLAAYEWFPPNGGSGETALLVHGWGGSAVAFEKMAPVLAQAGWNVIAIDLPSHGLTSGRSSNLIQMSEAVQTALWRFRPTAVVAHSFGAPATVLALERGPAVSRLVLLAPGEDLEIFARTFVRRAGFSEAMGDALLKRTEALVGIPPNNLRLRHHPPHPETSVLVVHDPQDDDVPFTAARTLASTWPKVEVLAALGIGHHGLPRNAQVIEATARYLEMGQVQGSTVKVMPQETRAPDRAIAPPKKAKKKTQAVLNQS